MRRIATYRWLGFLMGLALLLAACGGPVRETKAPATPAPTPAVKQAAPPSTPSTPPAPPASQPTAAAGRAAFDTGAVASFYKGKTMSVLVGFSPGGGYDLYARVLAEHLERHIPGNPKLIVENKPGAGSTLAVNQLYNSAKKDGTVIGMVPPGFPLVQALGKDGIQYDVTKLQWLGSMNKEIEVLILRTDSGITTFADILKTSARVGATGPGSTSWDYPKFANDILGTKLEIITGYPAAAEITLAIERGEVKGWTSTWTALKSRNADWMKNRFVNLIVQFGTERHPEMGSIPSIMELAKDEESRKLVNAMFAGAMMGRAFAAPPGVPPDRVAALRAAFSATMADPQLKAAAEKVKIDLAALSGEQVEQLAKSILATPKPLLDRLRPILIPSKK